MPHGQLRCGEIARQRIADRQRRRRQRRAVNRPALGLTSRDVTPVEQSRIAGLRRRADGVRRVEDGDPSSTCSSARVSEGDRHHRSGRQGRQTRPAREPGCGRRDLAAGERRVATVRDVDLDTADPRRTVAAPRYGSGSRAPAVRDREWRRSGLAASRPSFRPRPGRAPRPAAATRRRRSGSVAPPTSTHGKPD